MRYRKESPTFRYACRNVVASIPDSLDLRIARTAFSDCYDEFDRDNDRPGRNWQLEAKARWETFVREVADAVHDAFPSPTEWLAHFIELDNRWKGFESFSPNFRHLIVALAERHPTEGITAAEVLLATRSHPLAVLFDAVAISATKKDAAARLRLIRAAAVVADTTLQAAAVTCCSWSRREGSLPEEAWKILETLAPSAPPGVADCILSFVFWNDQQGTLRDWDLITALPFSSNDTALAGRIAASASELISRNHLQPDADSVARFFRRFESLSEPEGHEFERAFEKLAEAFPGGGISPAKPATRL